LNIDFAVNQKILLVVFIKSTHEQVDESD